MIYPSRLLVAFLGLGLWTAAHPEAAFLASVHAAGAASATASADFDAFLEEVWPPAQSAGVTRETYEQAIAGLTPDPAILNRPHKQGEFQLAVSAYLAQTVTGGRVAAGRAKMQAYADTLSSLAARYGTPAEILTAIWAVETNFGASQGASDVLRSLATLGAKGERRALFRDECAAALIMLQRGDATRAQLRGSWAGAMGQPQFMPSSYLKYAVKFSGGEAADIWGSAPDALASMANFLQQSGWNAALPALVEVAIPADFDWKPVDLDFARWRALGFRAADGAALPSAGEASLFLPEGANGPAFLITENFEVIRQYNTSDAYALSVSLLAARIAGSAGLTRPWPKGVVSLSSGERKSLQILLREKGFYSGAADGRLGRATRNAVHQFQISAGIAPADGFVTPEILRQLRAR